LPIDIFLMFAGRVDFKKCFSNWLPVVFTNRYFFLTILEHNVIYRLQSARSFLGFLVFSLCLFGATSISFAKPIEKVEVTFEYVEGLAEKASTKPWKPIADDSLLPEVLHGLTYDQMRNIRFRPEMQIWADENLPFRLALFHLGYLFRQPVEISEFSPTHTQRIRFARALFDYDKSGVDASNLPQDLGYAGFRIHYPLNVPSVFDELGVFLGASYYRMLGHEQIYGLSARGLALDTGLDRAEEFPMFTRFWIGKPEPNATSLKIYALLNSPSVAGAYEFVVKPGTETTVDIRQTLYFRQLPEVIGFAPLTSMFWFGENSRKPFDDFRPEVHDSDGIALKLSTGEFLWRPLNNDPKQRQVFSFNAINVRGFGLLQRDRDFRSYQDLEALYHRRPSVWVEPVGDWGEGVVKLIELPTSNELSDNIVAFWEPKVRPEIGKAHRLAYRQRWTSEQNPGGSGAYVVATRSGVHDWAPGERFVMVDFTGDNLTRLSPEANLVAVPTTDNPDVEALSGTVTRNLLDNSWRASFRLKVKDGAPRPAQVEVRCFLKHGENCLTETWSSLMPL